ncbi:MAG: PAS domain-containing protein, partial [Acidimicrobiales bacterium]
MDPAPTAESDPVAPERFLDRLWANIADPTLLALPPVAALFCLLRWSDIIAPEPYWLYITVLIGSGLVPVVYSAVWTGHRWYQNVYIAIYMAVVAVVVYTTGWGPILSIGFLFGAATAFQRFGSKAIVPCLIWTTVAVFCGQLAIALHLAPTIIHEPVVQGVAGLGLLGALLVIVLLGRAAVASESLEADLRRSERRFSALVNSSSDIVIIVGADGVLQYASPAFESVLGYPSAEVVNLLGEELVHPEDRAGLLAALD